MDVTELPGRVTARAPACRRMPCVVAGRRPARCPQRRLPDLDRSVASPEPWSVRLDSQPPSEDHGDARCEAGPAEGGLQQITAGW